MREISSQEAWDMEHMRTVGTKLRRADYDRLRALCEAAGLTPYSLMKRLLKEWMGQ